MNTYYYIKWLLVYGYDAVDWDDVINDDMHKEGFILYKAKFLPFIDDNPLVQLRGIFNKA